MQAVGAIVSVAKANVVISPDEIISQEKEMAVIINLQPWHQTFYLSRDVIQQYLPGSLFAEALEGDPNATQIDIPNPLVTPEVMQVIIDYFQRKEPPKHIPALVEASKYLNIPWLLYYAEPLYDQIKQPLPGQTWDTVANWGVFLRAVKQNQIYLVNYLLD